MAYDQAKNHTEIRVKTAIHARVVGFSSRMNVKTIETLRESGAFANFFKKRTTEYNDYRYIHLYLYIYEVERRPADSTLSR